jgi:hypothetical protein
MSGTAILESGTLSPNSRETLRTLLNSEPYLDFPSTADGPGVCICTSYADLRRAIETEYQARVNSRPTVPATYRAGGGRRKLPDGKPQYLDAETQTDVRWATPVQIESAPESQTRRTRKVRKALVSRTICLSGTDTESVGMAGAIARSPRQAGSQGLSSLARYLLLY